MFSIGPITPGIAATGNEQFDLNRDGTIDLTDRDLWLSEAVAENLLGSPYKVGDANLDGTVDGIDFLAWNDAKSGQSLLWSGGNFNGDSVVDGSDFLAWNNNKFTSVEAMTVPEPISLAFYLLLGTSPAIRPRSDRPHQASMVSRRHVRFARRPHRIAQVHQSV